ERRDVPSRPRPTHPPTPPGDLMKRFMLAVIVIALLSDHAAQAAIIFGTINRGVTASLNGNEINNSVTNTSPGPFASENEVDFSAVIGTGRASVEARQTSNVTTSVLSGYGAAGEDAIRPESRVFLQA